MDSGQVACDDIFQLVFPVDATRQNRWDALSRFEEKRTNGRISWKTATENAPLRLLS